MQDYGRKTRRCAHCDGTACQERHVGAGGGPPISEQQGLVPVSNECTYRIFFLQHIIDNLYEKMFVDICLDFDYM